MKKKDIYKLKRCLKDFKTKDHLCLFLDLFSFECLSKIIYRPPQCWAWALSLCFCFCFLHLILSIIVFSYFCEKLNFFWTFWFFLHAPNFVWTLLMIENFLLCPPLLFGHFQSLRFFLCLLHLPLVWGVILAKVIYLKKSIRLKRGLQMIYFSLVNGLSKMAFPHLKHMHFGSVSLAFMRVCNVISHYSFK